MDDTEYAKMILDVIPPVMRCIKNEMRSFAKSEMTVPQFRILARLSISSTTNCELADWMGVSPPTITRMVDALEKKNFVKRENEKKDRRQIKVFLTEKGRETFSRLRGNVQLKFSEKVSKLDKVKKQRLSEGLLVLSETFLI